MAEKHTIYFAGRITGGRKYADLYQRIVEQLKTYGKVLTEHVANPTVEAVIECIQSIWRKYGKCGLILFTFADEDNAGLTDVFIHDRDMDWLYDCDVIVAEVTQKSLGVGYEIGRAVALNKLVICLFRSDSEKKMYEIDISRWKEEDDNDFVETHNFEAMLKQVNQQSHMIFVGVPGSGKTVTVRHIALLLQRKGAEVEVNNGETLIVPADCIKGRIQWNLPNPSTELDVQFQSQNPSNCFVSNYPERFANYEIIEDGVSTKPYRGNLFYV
uniref:Putative 2'-deoxynucleoside 5'-phosphate N-hydrolase 1 n=1 Tax=Magallana gigas TaxID=29159 RepID=K1Q9Z1_MAGGI